MGAQVAYAKQRLHTYPPRIAALSQAATRQAKGGFWS